MAAALLKRFQYFEPKTLEGGASLLAKYGKKAVVLSGGTDLIVLLKKRVLKPQFLINITKIPDLDYIKLDRNGLRLGGFVTIRAVEKSELIQEKYQLLSEAACSLGSVQIRNMSTLSGNLMRASPSAEMAPPLLALGAEVRLYGPSDERTVPIEEFFKGPGTTASERGELLTEVYAPRLPIHTGTSFSRIARTPVDCAKVNVAVSITTSHDTCKEAKIALGAVAPTPIRSRKAEEVLKGKKLEERVIVEAAEVAAEETRPIDDVRSVAWYRREVTKVLVKRTILKAVERAE